MPARSRGSILAVKENFKSYIHNQAMKRGSIAFTANIEKSDSHVQNLEKIAVEAEGGSQSAKYKVMEKPGFMAPKIKAKPATPIRKKSMFRRMSNAIFGASKVEAPLKLAPLETEMVNKSELDGRISPTIAEEGEEEEDDKAREEEDAKDLSFLNSADNDDPVTLTELDGEDKKEKEKGGVPETGTGSPPEKRQRDDEELEKTASENSSRDDSDADSEKDEEAEAAKGQTWAERKKLRRQQEKMKEEEGKETKVEEEKDKGLSRKELKKQNRQRRRLASVHAIPNLGEEVEEEVTPQQTIEEKMAEQKQKDNEQLAAADRMMAENEAFLRKLRGEDGEQDGSVDSQGRELSETVVDTVTGSHLFKFERYFIYLQFTSIILSLNVAWPDAFEYSFGIFAWLSNEWYVWPFHKFFSLFRIKELVAIVDRCITGW